MWKLEIQNCLGKAAEQYLEKKKEKQTLTFASESVNKTLLDLLD